MRRIRIYWYNVSNVSLLLYFSGYNSIQDNYFIFYFFLLLYRTTSPCRTSSPSWVWTSCPRRTSSRWPEPGRQRGSSRNPSRLAEFTKKGEEGGWWCSLFVVKGGWTGPGRQRGSSHSPSRSAGGSVFSKRWGSSASSRWSGPGRQRGSSPSPSWSLKDRSGSRGKLCGSGSSVKVQILAL